LSDNKIRCVGTREGTWFLVILFISKILFSDISGYINHSGTAAYIQTAVCAVAVALIFVFTVSLTGGNTDIFEASRAAVGVTGAKAVGIILTVLLLFDACVMMRVYTDIISSIVLAESADLFIMLFLIAAVSFAAFAGVGVVAAYSYAVGIILVVSLAVILILNIPNYDFTNIYPVLGNGIDKILTGWSGIGAYADLLLIYLITPYLTEETSIKRTGLKAIIISGVVITVTTLLYIMTVEYPFSKHLTLPILEIAFDVNLDIVFQRAEGLFFFLWIFSGFIVTGAYLCFALVTFVKSFNLTDRRAPIGAFVFVAACIALIAGSSARERELYRIIYSVFAVVSFALPLFVFGIKKFKRRQIK